MKTYSAADIVISYGDKKVLGIAKGTFVKVSRESETVKLEAGGYGDVVATTLLNRIGKVVLTLQAESATNDDFSAFVRAVELGRRAIGKTFQMQNLNGQTLHHDDSAVIEKPADDERAEEAGTVEWTILCPNLDMTVAGTAQ